MTSEQLWTVLLAIEAVDPDLSTPVLCEAFDKISAEWARMKTAENLGTDVERR
jgi:hypothetical protein